MEYPGANLAEKVVDTLAIEEQLRRLLSSTYLSHSRRLPSFLSFVVQQTIAGQSDTLKERTLGITVFERASDFDPAADSIVRVTASELRKRIAQYYIEPGHEHELRIMLPPGSYVPHFCWPGSLHENEGGSDASLSDLRTEPAPQKRRHHRSWLTVGRGLAGIAIIGIIVGVLVFLHRPSAAGHSSVDAFWAPVLGSSDPILFCMADQNQYPSMTLRDASDLSRQITLHSNLTTVVIDDLSPLITLGGFLQSHGRRFAIKGADSTNLTDLRNGPTIFIGAFDNAWTLRLTRPLRYHFDNDEDMTEFAIVDSAGSPARQWKVNRAQQINVNNYPDYAIIARFNDPVTGHLAVIAAGVGLGGTIAAGQFLSNSDDMAEVMRKAGGRKNIEVVISTQIIGGEPGNPKMEAAYYW